MLQFHVFIQQGGDAALRCFLMDLTVDAVRERVVKPYNRGGHLVRGGEIVPVDSLRRIEICSTESSFDTSYEAAHAEHMRRIEALNTGDGVFFLSPGPGHDDMAQEWINVTEQFLKGRAPGSTTAVMHKLSSNPIVSATVATVVGGIILAVVVYYLNLK